MKLLRWQPIDGKAFFIVFLMLNDSVLKYLSLIEISSYYLTVMLQLGFRKIIN